MFIFSINRANRLISEEDARFSAAEADGAPKGRDLGARMCVCVCISSMPRYPANQ